MFFHHLVILESDRNILINVSLHRMMCTVCYHIHLLKEESCSVLKLNLSLTHGRTIGDIVTSQLVLKPIILHYATYKSVMKPPVHIHSGLASQLSQKYLVFNSFEK